MPRGRRSIQEGGSSLPQRAGTLRRTKSVAAKPSVADESIILEDHVPATQKQRARSSRASLLAYGTSSMDSLPTSQPAHRKRIGKALTIIDLSDSSGSTPQDLSSDGELSTPATSKVPTPLNYEGLIPSTVLGKSTTLEVQLPTKSDLEGFESDRMLRNSVYSLNPPKGKMVTEIIDSEEEDDDDNDNTPDINRDARTAQRLQQEEFAKIDKVADGKTFLSPFPTRRNALKRSTASTQSAIQQAPPVKKRRTISDSEDSTASDNFDWDAEVAALKSDYSDRSDLSDLSDDVGSFVTAGSEDDERYHSYLEPLSKRTGNQIAKLGLTRRPGGKNSASRRGTLTTATGHGSSRPIVIDDSQGGSADQVEDGDEDEVVSITSGSSSVSSVSAVIDFSISNDVDDVGVDLRRIASQRRAYRRGNKSREEKERGRLESHHPEILTMWKDLENMPVIKAAMAAQPQTISRQLKPFQLEGLSWMKEMEKTDWKGGLLGDEMGLGKTIQAVSLIMSDYPAKEPSLVLVPPVALMQWQSEIKSYTDGTLKTFIYHGTNQLAKDITVKELKAYDVIMMSYNSLESMYRKQEKGFKRKNGIHKQKSKIHSIHFHRIILDEAHSIKTRSTMTAKACFALQTNYRWCLTGTPLQNRIGEFFSLIRFLNIRPFALYLCKQCSCSTLEWSMDDSRCTHCKHPGMQHVSVFNQELLNPIQKFGNFGPGHEAFKKLRLMTDRIMLRRLKKDHTNAMELPVKEIIVDRQFFGEEENDFANSIMTNGQRKFDTYVAQGVLLNNYANIFGLIMQMRQVADHPDLLLKKHAEGGQNILVCCICDEPAEDTIRSRCKHDFCRVCVSSYVQCTETPDCPMCHIALSIDLEQPELEQDENLVKKSSIINRIKMENWVSSSKIELLVHDLHKLRSDNASHKSIIFSQFTTMLQLIEWRLRRAGITTVMLDGSMTPAQRQASIEHFMNNVDVECFLVSLKAGGVALNLTEASRVFIVDPWWNPAAEWQSADRCHRIGQTRPCTITRLCIEDSVESRMVLIQEKKTSMIHTTINADDKAMESLTPEDMQFLFRGT